MIHRPFAWLLLTVACAACGGTTVDDKTASPDGGSAGSGGAGGSAGSAGGAGAAGAGGGAGDASVGCPTAAPQDTTVCAPSADGTVCHYPVECCGDTVAACAGGVWHVVPGPCMGGGGACPLQPPSAGDPCPQSCAGPLTCSYDTCGGGTPNLFATCAGTWSLTASPCVDDAGAADAGGLDAGDVCGQSAGGAACGPGLACCYPCGIPGCDFQCAPLCTDPGCFNGCHQYP